jgi:hypothetical protein
VKPDPWFEFLLFSQCGKDSFAVFSARHHFGQFRIKPGQNDQSGTADIDK